MIQTNIYTVLMILFALYVIVKHFNKMGIILVVWYAIIGVMASVAVNQGCFEDKDISFFSYIFLIFIFAIAFSPFLSRKSDVSVGKLALEINIKYVIFAYVFVITCIISVSFFLPQVMDLFATGDWKANRANLYNGSLSFNTAWYQYYSLQFSGYTRLLGLIVGFAFLRNNVHVKLGWACILLGVATETMSAMYTSSRGSIVNIAILVGVIYVFFYQDLEKKKRNLIVFLCCMALFVIVPYVLEVTVSRFSSEASSSLIEYFGQSPVVFNYGVSGINKYLYGEYAFGSLFGGREISPMDVGGSWGSGFYTFVGWLFIDWGWIGTIIVASIIAFLTDYIIKKDTYLISDVYIIFFVYYTLLQGVFVIGRDYVYYIVAAILIYWFLKVFFDKYTIKIGRIEL